MKKKVLVIVLIAAFVASLFIMHVCVQYDCKRLEKEYFAELNEALDQYGQYQRTIYDM